MVHKLTSVYISLKGKRRDQHELHVRMKKLKILTTQCESKTLCSRGNHISVGKFDSFFVCFGCFYGWGIWDSGG